MDLCANCGREGGDGSGVKLKNCTACLLVKYCSVDCQKAQRKQHKSSCMKRAAELKDANERLYNQGHERSEEDFCPICTLPIPLRVGDHSVFKECCTKTICLGCDFAAQRRGMLDCPFCRKSMSDNAADTLAQMRTRAEKKDPAALNYLGLTCFLGDFGLQEDMWKAVELWAEAAELGSIGALHHLGVAYHDGEGVGRDTAKAIHFWSKAAMQGHVESRHNLGCCEGDKGNPDNAVRHYLISAKMGYKKSLDTIKGMFMAGLATKEQYAQALRQYQDAVEEMKSHERDEAVKANFRGML